MLPNLRVTHPLTSLEIEWKEMEAICLELGEDTNQTPFDILAFHSKCVTSAWNALQEKKIRNFTGGRIEAQH